MQFKSYPYIEKKLLDLLKKQFPPLPYNEEMTSEELARKSARRAGAIDVITKLESIHRLQEKEKRGR